MANAVLIDTVAVQNLIASLRIVGITGLGIFLCLVVLSSSSKLYLSLNKDKKTK